MTSELEQDTSSSLADLKDGLRAFAETYFELPEFTTRAASGAKRLLRWATMLPSILDHVPGILGELTRNQLMQYVDFGWYPDYLNMPFSDLADLGEQLRSGEPAAHEAAAQYYRDRLPTIETELRQCWPPREVPLHEGFEAHRQKLFYCSIPVFLAQADGIARDWIANEKLNSLYSRSKLRRALRRRIDRFLKAAECSPLERELKGAYALALITPLTEATKINVSRNERAKFERSRGFNRNLVIHGEDQTYGSEENSLRAVSFLYFVSTVVRQLRNRETELSGS